MAEFGPALFTVLIVGLFPMLALIYLAVAFCCGFYYNQLEAREIAIACPSGSPAIRPTFTRTMLDGDFLDVYPELTVKANDFRNSGLARFIKFNEVECVITYYASPYLPGPTNANGWAAPTSSVSTTISVGPFFNFSHGFFHPLTTSIPVPGLTEPAIFKYYTKQVQEQQLPVGW